MIEIGALRALALSAVGDVFGGVAPLADTIALAAPEGYVRVLVNEGPAMAGLLGRLLSTRQPPAAAQGHLRWLVRACQAASASDPDRHRRLGLPGLVELLTDRERKCSGTWPPVRPTSRSFTR